MSLSNCSLLIIKCNRSLTQWPLSQIIYSSGICKKRACVLRHWRRCLAHDLKECTEKEQQTTQGHYIVGANET